MKDIRKEQEDRIDKALETLIECCRGKQEIGVTRIINDKYYCRFVYHPYRRIVKR